MRIAFIDEDGGEHIYDDVQEILIEYSRSKLIVRHATEFTGLRAEIAGRLDLGTEPISVFDLPFGKVDES